MESSPNVTAAASRVEDSASPDLTVCDREPITRLERIQPFGFLMAMARDWTVQRVSANLEDMVGISVERALGDKVDALLDGKALHDIRNRMLSLYLTRSTERLFGISLVKGRPPFDVSVHQSGDCFILEGEPSIDVSQSDAAGMVRTAMARIEARNTLELFHTDAARQIRALTGFDRVMVYRFDEEGDGEVIAEALSADMESYMGLHYPASDIPQQARELYLRNRFRIIPDALKDSVPVVTHDRDLAPLDLTLSVTRAVSPVHIEYLMNMGVQASMSISIIVERKLWGLIACHHSTPRLPSFVVRTAAELFGHMYSLSLDSRLRDRVRHDDARLANAIKQILSSIVGDDALLARAEWMQDVLCDVIGGHGTAIVVKGGISFAGEAPPLEVIEKIVAALKKHSAQEIFATDQLAELLPDHRSEAIGPVGVLAIPISSVPRDYILLFRREALRDIRWAGNPQKPVHSASDAVISPRKSFAVFEQRIAGRSLRFTERDYRFAEVIRSALIEVILRVSETLDDARQRASERQEILIAELNHRVRNVLALMRGLIAQSSHDAESVGSYVASLNGRIMSLARAHDRITRRNWGPAQLADLIEDEIAAYVPTDRGRLSLRGAPVWLTPKAFSTLALVVHELVTNSCKYGALSTTGRVEIDLDITPDGAIGILWRERNGPQVSAPQRRGFGSVIIERTIPFDLGGRASVEYAPDGLVATFVIPSSHVAETVQGAARPAAGARETAVVTPSTAPLKDRRVLLLEDNFIVALEAEELLRELGATSVTVASTVADALQVIDREKIEFAMLDINLGQETSDAVAARLSTLKVPYMLASGYDEPDTRDALGASVLVTKPFDREVLAAAVTRTLSSP